MEESSVVRLGLMVVDQIMEEGRKKGRRGGKEKKTKTQSGWH
jgi:hypothetical protein